VLDGGPGYDAVDGDSMVASGKPQPPIAVSEDGQANDGVRAGATSVRDTRASGAAGAARP